MDVKNVYPNIKRIAKKKAVNIRDVEMAAGVSPGYFSRRKDMSPVTVLIKATEFLGVKLEDLLDEAPVETNADRFKETFGLDPRIEMPRDDFRMKTYKTEGNFE